MAAFLTSLAFLALGVAIGWFIKRRWFAPIYAELHEELDTDRYMREWRAHAEAHAKAQAASVVWTAPEMHIHGSVDSASLPKVQEMIEKSNRDLMANLKRNLGSRV